MPRDRRGALRSSREITIYTFNMRPKKPETVNSDTLALEQHPFSCRSSHELRYRGNGEKEKRGWWKRRGKKKYVERFILFLFSPYVVLPLSLSLSLSLVPPLLNLTIKQDCKNRMFLAEAQQWQSREGTGPYIKQRGKKIPLLMFNF